MLGTKKAPKVSGHGTEFSTRSAFHPLDSRPERKHGPRRSKREPFQELVSAAIIACLEPYRAITRTITTDNGKEFAGHAQVAQALDADIYFAKPYHSWERGLNEHTNGQLRKYFPKSMRFLHVPEADV